MRSELEKMLAGELYNAMDSEFESMARKKTRLLEKYHKTGFDDEEERREILKELFDQLGENAMIKAPFYCDYGSNIAIGDDFFANYDCIMLDVSRITIGDNVMFGPRVGLYGAGHPIDAEVRASGLEFGREITIGNNVWIGANVVVNPGVTIGDNVIIGSGSVVTKNIDKNVIAAGNPCRVIRMITEEDTIYWQKEKQRYELEKAQNNQ